MPNSFKKSSLFILFCLLTLSLISYRWSEWINLPPHYVVEPYGDGIKSYLVPLYHIKFDKTFNHYDGMNYPYGENIVAADGLATVSFPLKWLYNNGVDFTDYLPKLIHFLLLLSFLVGVLYVYKIGLLLGLPFYLAAATSLTIAFLSPQLLRMEAHLGLAHLAVIPGLLYYWLLYSKKPYFKTLVPLIILTFLAAGIHFYYVAFIFSFSLLFSFFWYFFSEKKPPVPVFIMHVLGAVLIPFSLLFIWVNGGNQPLDRSPQPWGFFQFNATPGGLLFSQDNPFWRWVSNHLFSIKWETFSDIERYHYLGLTFPFFLLLLIGIHFLPKHRNYFYKLFSVKDAGLLAVLLSAIILLLISFGLPFIISGFEGLLSYTGPFRQFRSVGRFAWVFYYVIHILMAVSLFRFFKGKGIAFFVWSIYFALMSLDLIHYHRRLNVGMEAIPELEMGRKLSFLTGIHPEKFQSILTIPYFNLGSDQFWREPEGFILQKALLMSAKTGLPTNSAMLTRTSRKQTINQLQWVSEPYKYPLLLKGLNDQRPFLLMVDKYNLDNERGKPYAHLLKYASILHDEDRMSLYLLPYNSFEKSVLDKVKEANILMSSTLKTNTNSYSSEDDAEFLFEDWNKGNVNQQKYAGNSGCKYLLNSGDVLFKGKVADNAKEGPWIFSIWMYIDEDKRATSQFTIKEVTKNKDKYEEVFPSHPNIHVFDDNGWALIEIPWVLHRSGSQITIIANNPDLKKTNVFIDEMLVRPLSSVLTKTDNDFIWVNNRRYPKLVQ